jgi:hypothetical protein
MAQQRKVHELDPALARKLFQSINRDKIIVAMPEMLEIR